MYLCSLTIRRRITANCKSQESRLFSFESYSQRIRTRWAAGKMLSKVNRGSAGVEEMLSGITIIVMGGIR